MLIKSLKQITFLYQIFVVDKLHFIVSFYCALYFYNILFQEQSTYFQILILEFGKHFKIVINCHEIL